MLTSKGAAAYAKVGLETQVMSASPHQLIAMLFASALSAIRAAGLYMDAGDVAKKGQAISRAIDIVGGGLSASLDHDKAEELAAQLESLYDYVVRRLLHANLHNDKAALEEAGKLLGDIASAWSEIGTVGH